MLNLTPMTVLPPEIQQGFRAALHNAMPTDEGLFQLIDCYATAPASWQSQRITVLVVDENGIPIPSVNVAFAYDTADHFLLPQDTKWIPPDPRQAFIVPTEGSGQIDQIQGSTIKEGQPGGVTVYIFEPDHYSSDHVSGCGMLADHTGMHLTFKLQRIGVKSYGERIAILERRVTDLEAGVIR